MSDAQVLAAVEQMEAWLQEPGQNVDAVVLASWNREFLAAVETAERGPGWAQLVARAHALGAQLEARAVLLGGERNQLRKLLDAQSQGDRALKGYGAAAR